MEPEAGFLPQFGGLSNARMAQRVTPDVEAAPLPELPDDAEDGPCFQPAISGLPALPTRLEEWPGL